MDELELLKKDWQKREAQHPQLTFEDIHKMIWKKSSSIVKWILIISILEFTLPHLLYLLPSTQAGFDVYEKLGMKNFIIILSVVQYVIIFYFIYQFYRRYKEISVLDSAKNLMRKIIRTRKTVKFYIIFSLSLILFSFLAFAFAIYLSDDLSAILGSMDQEAIEKITIDKLKRSIILGIIIGGIVFTALIGGVYFLLYGRLLRKLKKNYKELKTLEV